MLVNNNYLLALLATVSIFSSRFSVLLTFHLFGVPEFVPRSMQLFTRVIGIVSSRIASRAPFDREFSNDVRKRRRVNVLPRLTKDRLFEFIRR